MKQEKTQEKKRGRGRPKGGKNKPRAQKPLPPPLEVESENPATASSPVSQSFSTPILDEPRPDEPLSAEAERILAGIPRIQEAPGDALPPADDFEPESDELSIALSGEEQIALVLQKGFGWIADLRDRDCYRMDDPTAAKLGRVWSPVVRDAWTKYAPMFLAQFAEAHPGLLTALLTTSVIVGPMVSADLRQTREERRAKSPVESKEPVVQPKPKSEPAPAPTPEPAKGGLIYAEGRAA